MNELSDTELLSAYVDGELTGDELLRAERLVASSAEHRQFVEELRQLGARLRKLPRHSLGSSFAERVLRQAEREVLRQPVDRTAATSSEVRTPDAPPLAVPAISASIAPANVEVAEQSKPHLRLADRPIDWQRWRRPITYIALTLAAATMLMLNPWRDQAPQRVAVAPKNQPGGPPNNGEAEVRARLDRPLPAVGEAVPAVTAPSDTPAGGRREESFAKRALIDGSRSTGASQPADMAKDGRGAAGFGAGVRESAIGRSEDSRNGGTSDAALTPPGALRPKAGGLGGGVGAGVGGAASGDPRGGPRGGLPAATRMPAKPTPDVADPSAAGKAVAETEVRAESAQQEAAAGMADKKLSLPAGVSGTMKNGAAISDTTKSDRAAPTDHLAADTAKLYESRDGMADDFVVVRLRGRSLEQMKLQFGEALAGNSIVLEAGNDLGNNDLGNNALGDIKVGDNVEGLGAQPAPTPLFTQPQPGSNGADRNRADKDRILALKAQDDAQRKLSERAQAAFVVAEPQQIKGLLNQLAKSGELVTEYNYAEQPAARPTVSSTVTNPEKRVPEQAGHGTVQRQLDARSPVELKKAEVASPPGPSMPGGAGGGAGVFSRSKPSGEKPAAAAPKGGPANEALTKEALPREALPQAAVSKGARPTDAVPKDAAADSGAGRGVATSRGMKGAVNEAAKQDAAEPGAPVSGPAIVDQERARGEISAGEKLSEERLDRVESKKAPAAQSYAAGSKSASEPSGKSQLDAKAQPNNSVQRSNFAQPYAYWVELPAEGLPAVLSDRFSTRAGAALQDSASQDAESAATRLSVSGQAQARPDDAGQALKPAEAKAKAMPPAAGLGARSFEDSTDVSPSKSGSAADRKSGRAKDRAAEPKLQGGATQMQRKLSPSKTDGKPREESPVRQLGKQSESDKDQKFKKQGRVAETEALHDQPSDKALGDKASEAMDKNKAPQAHGNQRGDLGSERPSPNKTDKVRRYIKPPERKAGAEKADLGSYERAESEQVKQKAERSAKSTTAAAAERANAPKSSAKFRSVTPPAPVETPPTQSNLERSPTSGTEPAPSGNGRASQAMPKPDAKNATKPAPSPTAAGAPPPARVPALKTAKPAPEPAPDDKSRLADEMDSDQPATAANGPAAVLRQQLEQGLAGQPGQNQSTRMRRVLFLFEPEGADTAVAAPAPAAPIEPATTPAPAASKAPADH